MKLQRNKGITKFKLRSILASCALAACGQAGAASISTVTDARCNSRLDVTISGSTRSSAVTTTSCLDRTLAAPTTGFSLAAPSTRPDSTTPDSAAMASAGVDLTGGGGLYEAFVASAREAAVLFTPNNALMMSRSVEGVARGVNWNMGLAVQPVSSGTNAWLIGTYTLLRANNDVRVVDTVNQTNAGLSEVFDPATLRITFDGISSCTISSYSSWLGYSLTTDPVAISGQDGTDYALHQAVYAGEGYAGVGGVHNDSVHTFTACDYTLSSDGKLFITYDYNDGGGTPRTVENSYFISSDMRYLVSTVDATADIFRGFEVGVRVKDLTLLTQDARNDGAAGTYLFNSPTIELQGATGSLADNVHLNAEKITHCMSRGKVVLSADTAVVNWNTCTWDMTSTCSVQGQEGKTSGNSITVQHYTAQGAASAAACRFQVGSNGSMDFVVNLDTAEGAQDMTFSGAIADNSETLVLRGKYVGTDMTNPSASNNPQRKIKNDLILSALVGIKHSASLVDDPDSDGLNNLAEFLYPANVLGATTENDYNNSGIASWIWKGQSNGYETVSQIWQLTYPLVSPNFGSPTRFYPPPFPDQANWEIMTSGDFNKDGDADIVWRHKTLATWKVWQMQNGTRVAQTAPADFDLAHEWTVVGAGDTDKDGDDDVILNKSSTGEVLIWEMQNHAIANTHSIGTKAGYLVNRIGDFNADGDVDLLFRQTGADVLVTWELQTNALVLERALSNTGTGYNPICAGDFDADGDDDIMLQNSTTTQEKWFEMENYARASQKFGSSSVGFVFKGCGDYDGDGDADSFWQRSSDDVNRIVLQHNYGVSKQTVYTNAFGGVNPGAAGYGFVYRGNSN